MIRTLAARSHAAATTAAPPGYLAAALAGAVLFVLVFREPAVTLALDWWSDPDAGHGLLLAPVAIWLAWRADRSAEARPARIAGSVVLISALALRIVSQLAAELFTMRLSMLLALAGLTLYAFGWRQLRQWWLPALLLLLSIPLPQVVAGTLALPLQLQASQLGAALLEARYVPVVLTGNVLHLPGQSLFVTEACSGLRSLTALLALGVLIGGLWLRSPWLRTLLIAVTLPVAVVLNGVRVFLTGYLIYWVNPDFGSGFMHVTEGWVMFVAAFAILGGAASLLVRLEAIRSRAVAA